MQGSNGDAGIENRLVDTVAEAEGGMNGESSMEAHTGPYVRQPARGSLLSDSGAQTGAL